MIVLLLLLLSAFAGGSCILLWLIIRARNKRLLLADAHGIAADAPGEIGISVLCSGVYDMEQIENLLQVEYPRYEVVVVLDAQRYPAQFEALVARYRIIGVEWASSGELPVTGVRALGRSRKRNYRRLVLIDRVQDTPEGDLDAAAAIATYDYVLPVCVGQFLLPDAVMRLVAELAENPAGSVRLVRTWIGESTALLSREAVVSAGGFRQHPVQHVPVKACRVLWEPLLSRRTAARVPGWLKSLAAVVLGVALVGSAWSGMWIIAAVLITVALVWSAVRCASLVVADIPGSGGRLFVLRQCPCKLLMKNFSV